MKLDRSLGMLPELTRLGGRTARRGLSLLGICLLAAVIGGPASLAGGARLNAQAHHPRLAAFVAGSTPQTITFDQPLDTKVGEPVTLSASAAPGLVVLFTSNTPTVCTVSGSAVTTMTAGVCVITASQDGDDTYAAAPEVARSFQLTAGQAAQTISFTLPPEVQSGVPVGQSAALSASASSGLAVLFTSSTPAVCTVSGSTVMAVASGTCTITATQGGSADYAATTPVTQSLQVTTGQTPQTISFTLPPEVQSGVPVGQSAALSASASSGLAVLFTSSTPAVCTVSGSTVMAVASGTCTITATQGGSADYAATTPVTQSLQVTTGQTAQTISFTPPPEAVTPGVPVGEPVDLSASASPDPALPVAFTSDTPQVCRVSGSTVLTVGTGTCTITASQVGSANYAPAPNVQDSFEVYTGQSQTITFDPLPDRPVDTRFPLTATASSKLRVSFSSSTQRVCTVSGTTTSGFTASTVTTGTCTITATQGGDEFWAPAPDVTRSFTVTKKGQTITFDPLPDAAVKTQFALTATASSEQPVSFSSSTQRVCTVSGTTTSGFTASTVTTGTCTITATQGGDEFWAPAPDVTRSFTVTKRGQTITFDPLPDAAVKTQFALTATASSEQPVSFSSSTQRVCTVSGTTTSGFTASTVTTGTCTITATQDGNQFWAPAPDVTRSFTVTKRGQTITFGPLPDAAVKTQFALTATASSEQPVSFSSSTQRVCTVSGTTTSGFTASTVTTGTCTITATQDGNQFWAPAPDVTRSFTVTKRGQTITFGPLPDAAVKTQFALTATASSEQPVSFSSSTQRVCTVSGTTTSGFTASTVTTGTCIIAATQDGGDTWAAATPAKQSFTVTKRAQTITFGPLPDTQVRARVPLTATASSKLGVSFSSSTQRVCTVSGTTASGFTATTRAAGTCIITAGQNGNDTWAAATDVQRSFRVIPAGKKSQTIAFAQPSPAAVGQSVTLSASASSGLAISFTSSTSAVCTVSGSTVTTVAVGTCVITASQGGNADYAAARDVARSFQVNPAGPKPQTITFTPPTGTKVGEPVTLSAFASSGLPVSFASNTPAVCTVAGSTATQVAAGTCAITASQSGNASYEPARDVAQSFQVNPAGPKVHTARHKSQTITFTPPPATTVGEPVTLSASASSGLPVSFASSTPAVCTVSGSTVTTMVAGACMITASQGGNASYAPAQDVTQSFQVNPAGPRLHTGHKPQTINFDPPPQAKAGEPVSLSASASSGLPVVFTSDTPPVCTVSGSTVITMAAGACTVTASQDGSAYYAAAPIQTRSFQVDPASSTWTGPLVFLLAGAVMTAAGVAAGVRRLRLRSRRALVRAPSVRAAPEPGPPGQVDVQNTGPTATRTVRIESSPGTSITTIEEARP